MIEVVALHRALRLEAGEREGIDIFLQRHAVLQAERHRDGEIVDDGAQRRAFLVHVDEDLTETPVVIFAGAEIDLVAADHRLLGVAFAAVGHALALAHHHDTLDDLLNHFLGERCGARRGRTLEEGLDGILFVVLVSDKLRIERLAELGAIAVECVGFQRQLPGEQIGLLAVLDRRLVRHVDGLGDGAGNEWLRRRHHADVAFDREIALAGAAAGIGAVEHRIMLGLEMRRAFHRHGAADMDVGGLDLALAEAERGEEVEGRRGEILG